jgi:hypothetical protein
VNDHRASYPHTPPDVAALRAAEGLPAAAPVAANFNGLYKIEPRVFRLWARVLAALPAAALWLVSSGGSSDDNIRAEAGPLTRLVRPRPPPAARRPPPAARRPPAAPPEASRGGAQRPLESRWHDARGSGRDSAMRDAACPISRG